MFKRQEGERLINTPKEKECDCLTMGTGKNEHGFVSILVGLGANEKSLKAFTVLDPLTTIQFANDLISEALKVMAQNAILVKGTTLQEIKEAVKLNHEMENMTKKVVN